MMVVLAIVAICAGLVTSAIQKARGAAARLSCANNLRQISLGLHQYHTPFERLPTGVVHAPFHSWIPATKEPFALLNWHARILPYIGQEPLWRATLDAYARDPVHIDSPPHIGSTTQLKLFLCPLDVPRDWFVRPPKLNPASTSYLGVSGTASEEADGLLFMDSNTSFSMVLDGLSQTLIAGERPASLRRMYGRWYGGWGPWYVANAFVGVAENLRKENDLGCPSGPYRFENDKLENICSVFHFWSLHPGGGNFAFADGSVRFLTYGAASVLPALATRAGGEAMSLPD